MEGFLDKIQCLVEQVAEREGCQFYDLEFLNSLHPRILRIYIDKPNGVNVDDCANVSRGLSLLLDVEDLIPGEEYSLEVSSPGAEKPLKHPRHFVSVVGEQIWINALETLENFGLEDRGLQKAKKVTGVLESTFDKGICLRVGEELLEIPFNKIKKSKVVFDFNKV